MYRWFAVTALAGALAEPAAAQKTEVVQVNGSSSGSRPRLVAAGTDVYMVWDDRRNGRSDIYFSRSTDGGATWSSNRRLDTDAPGAASSSEAAIAVSGRSIFVVWRDTRNSGAFTYTDLYFNRSLDRGLTWMPSDVQVDLPVPTNSYDPQIAAVGSSVYVTWTDTSKFAPNVFFHRSTDSGTTWPHPIVQLNTNPPGVRHAKVPQIAAVGSSVYVLWSDSRNAGVTQFTEDVYFNRSADGGATWLSSDVRLDTDPAGSAWSSAPRIAASGSFVYATWYDGRNVGFDIYFNVSPDGGATWRTADVRLNTNALGTAASSRPAIAASDSSVYVAWQDDRNGNGDIYFNRSTDNGTTWLASDVRVDTDPPGSGYSFSPAIAASGSSVYVLWPDDRKTLLSSQGEDVFFNRSTDAGATWLASDVQLDPGPFVGARSWSWQVVASGSSVYTAWEVGLPGEIRFNIPFGFQPYGGGSGGSFGVVPRLTGTGQPTLGSPVALDTQNALGGAAGAMLVGVGPNSKIALPLLGGTLLVSPAIAIPFTLGGVPGLPSAGTASLPLMLPPTPSSVGANLNFQSVLLDAGAARGISMTNAVEMWIG